MHTIRLKTTVIAMAIALVHDDEILKRPGERRAEATCEFPEEVRAYGRGIRAAEIAHSPKENLPKATADS
jgi:hypothetical protein